MQPDLLWVAEDNTNILFEENLLRGAPDLTVEIFSPGSARNDRREKFRLYEKHGVREYWMVDPDEKLLEIWQQQDGRFVRVDAFGAADPCKSPLLGDVDMKAIFPK